MSRYTEQVAAGAPSRHTGTLGSHVSSQDASYYALHHLTALPESVTKFADRTFSQARIERALHSRMEQFTKRDSDRFRQLLRWIKNKQTVRPYGGPDGQQPLIDEGSGVSIIRREQFQNILEVLGVFATQDQADNLFNKYDVHQRGFLTLHELMCRASSALESDFAHGVSELASGRNEGPRSDEMFAAKGKKQFLRQKLTGEGERPITPKQNSNLITVPLIVKALREKLRINAPVGVTQSIPRARREFARVFEYFDPQQLGVITVEQLVRALHAVNFPVTVQHQRLLLDAFPSPTAPMMLREARQTGSSWNNGSIGNNPNNPAGAGASNLSASIYSVKTDEYNRPLQDPSARGFDYIGFILYVFPDGSLGPGTTVGGNPLSTSLFLNHELGKEFFDNMSVEERRKRGLPPTHEQYDLMAAQEKAEKNGQEEKDNDGNGSHNGQSDSIPSLPSPLRSSQSQFSRERAPPTPQPPLTPAEQYRNISGRQPPREWLNQTVQKNPYLQTVLQTGAKHAGYPFGGAGSGVSQVLQLPSPTSNGHSQNLVSPVNGSQSARSWRESSGSNGAGTLPPTTPGTPSRRVGGGDSSNALNPFASPGASGQAQFIPASAFLNPPRSAAPAGNPRYGGINGASTYGASGAEAFTNILAAPSPARRPTTGITTYVRGGAGKALPPVTPRSARN